VIPALTALYSHPNRCVHVCCVHVCCVHVCCVHVCCAYVCVSHVCVSVHVFWGYMSMCILQVDGCVDQITKIHYN